MHNLWFYLVVGLASVLLGMLGVVFPKALAWLKAHTKNVRYAGALARLAELTATVVLELNQTVVDQLKRDSKWDKAEAAKIKELALAKIKSYLGRAGLAELCEVLGLDPKLVDDLIGSYIEAQVLEAQTEVLEAQTEPAA
jgi:hypothetical protein